MWSQNVTKGLMSKSEESVATIKLPMIHVAHVDEPKGI
jgi:hypothetical protein